MKNHISVKTELMKNQKHAVVMDAQTSFQAFQSQDGHALIFSLGSDHCLYLSREIPGHLTGWEKFDLSSVLSQKHDNERIHVKAFTVAQSANGGAIDIVLAVSQSDQDYIYLVQKVDSKELTSDKELAWQRQTPDNVGARILKLNVDDVYIAQTSEGEYIVVDIFTDEAKVNQRLIRFFLDPKKRLGQTVWNEHVLPGDFNTSTLTTCVGKNARIPMEGIYTKGTINGKNELLFAALCNPFDRSVAPTITRFVIPQDASAIATAVATGNTTHLYVAGGRQLIFFPAKEQVDGSHGHTVLEHDLFHHVTDLHTNSNQSEVIVWGRNQQAQVFYTRCRRGEENNAMAWSEPVPIATNITSISTYIHHHHGGTVIFAHGEGDQLLQLTQDPITSHWHQRSIVLPATAIHDVLEMNTYTSHIKVTNESHASVAGFPLEITASSPVSLYINNQFTVLSPDLPITVKSDASGTVNILQETQSLSAVCYLIRTKDSDEQIHVNPMVSVLDSMDEIKSGKDLGRVKITDQHGTSRPLLDSGIPMEQKDATAQALQQFISTSRKLPEHGKAKLSNTVRTDMLKLYASPFPASLVQKENAVWGMSFENGEVRYHQDMAAVSQFFLAHDGSKALATTPSLRLASTPVVAWAGDIFNWLRHAVDEVKHFFIHVVDGISSFFITIGEKLYTFVLDCYQTVVSAVELVFKKIKVAFENLMKWVGFVFMWDDILVTHRVMKNLFLHSVQNAVAYMPTVRAEFVKTFKGLQNVIDSWADIPNFDATAASVMGARPAEKGQNSPGANYGVYHFQSNSGNARLAHEYPAPPASMFDVLLNLIKEQEATMANAYHAIQSDIVAQLANLSMTQIIKRFLAIVSDTLLQSMEHILIAAFDVFVQLANLAIEGMTASIEIPVISWLYSEITGGEKLSMLDVMCLVAAIPATVIYKLTTNKTPFPTGNSFTKNMLEARNFAEMKAAFHGNQKRLSTTEQEGNKENIINILKFVTGIFSCIASAVVVTLAAGVQSVGQIQPLAARVIAGFSAVFNIAYVAPGILSIIDIATHKNYDLLNDIFTILCVLKGFLIDITFASTPIPSFVDCHLSTVWNIPLIWFAIDKFNQENPGLDADIPAFIGNAFFNLSGMIAPIGALLEEPISKGVALSIQFEMMLNYGVLMLISGAISAFEKNTGKTTIKHSLQAG